VLAWSAAAICLLPMFAVAFAALTGGWEVTGRLAETVLAPLCRNHGDPRADRGLGTAIIGTSTAWLVTATRFPGHRILEVALALPLAFPAYVLAYAYTDFLDHPGIVQSTLRDLTGWGPRDYWFPKSGRSAARRRC
jgi:iron(III) transport system permease protein